MFGDYVACARSGDRRMAASFALADGIARMMRAPAEAWARARGRVARINARLTRRAGSPRVLIGQLGMITTCITVLAPPLTYATIGAMQLQQRAEEQAMLGARHVEVQFSNQAGLDRLNQVSINVLHATSSPSTVVVATWVTDETGKILVFQGR